jgi:hypothetical protein
MLQSRPHEAGLRRFWRADSIACPARSRNYPMLQKSKVAGLKIFREKTKQRAIADSYDLNRVAYTSRPSLLSFVRQVRGDIRDMRPRDMIDMQSLCGCSARSKRHLFFLRRISSVRWHLESTSCHRMRASFSRGSGLLSYFWQSASEPAAAGNYRENMLNFRTACSYCLCPPNLRSRRSRSSPNSR